MIELEAAVEPEAAAAVESEAEVMEYVAAGKERVRCTTISIRVTLAGQARTPVSISLDHIN